MDFKKTIEQHPVIFFLSTILIGFIAGLGAYRTILEIAQLKTVREGSYILVDKLDKSYIRKDDIKYLIKDSQFECNTNRCIDKNILKEKYVAKEKKIELEQKLKALESNFDAYKSNFDISNYKYFKIVKLLFYSDSTRLSRYKIDRVGLGQFTKQPWEGTFPFFKESKTYVDSEQTGWVIPKISFAVFVEAFVNDRENGNSATVSLYLPEVRNDKILVRGGEKWDFKYKGYQYRFEICSLNYISAMAVRLVGFENNQGGMTEFGDICKFELGKL